MTTKRQPGSKRSIRVEVTLLIKSRLDSILEHGDLSSFVQQMLRQLVMLSDTVGEQRTRQTIRLRKLRLTTFIDLHECKIKDDTY